jgi:uncharacterized protein
MKTKFLWALALVFIALFVCSCNKGLESQSTISVYGTGTVAVQPDMIQMSITLSNVAQTTKAAQDEVSRMVRQALNILKEANIEDKNINTASLSFSSEYEYTTRRILVGQRAEQRITFSIEDINDDKASEIIDRLIQINGIELNQVIFSVKNTTEYFVKSRELAYKKALEKANQYAELSNLKVIKVLSIADQGTQQVSPMSNRMMNQQFLADAMTTAKEEASTILPMGELEITTNILAVFLLK